MSRRVAVLWLMHLVRMALFGLGSALLLWLIYIQGAGPIAAAMASLAWWQFGLICIIQGLSTVFDSLGWRYAFARQDVAPFHRLLAARCAGDAVNLITALASVGGEALKAWLLRRDVSYRETVPSLIVSKTAGIVAQALLSGLAFVVALKIGGVNAGLLASLGYLLVVEVAAIGGFVAVQVAGVVSRLGQLIGKLGVNSIDEARRLDEALRSYYRDKWPRFLTAVALHFVGWVLGIAEVWVIFQGLGLHASLATCTIIEGLWTLVRFATFLVPASVGPLEGASAAAFEAFGFSASAGLAFALVRRARQMVWVGVGMIMLMAMRPASSPEPQKTRHPHPPDPFFLTRTSVSIKKKS